MEITACKTNEQIAAVAGLAKEIWQEHYTPIIGADQVAYMLEKFQSEKAIANQIGGEGYFYFIASENGCPAGYCAVSPADDSLFLSKLYVLRDFRGRGAAKAMLEKALSECGVHAPVRVHLTVNKQNGSAIAAYEKMGFEITASVTNGIGDGYAMDDYIMEAVFQQ